MNQTPGVKIAIRKNIHCMVLYLYIPLLPSYCPTILPLRSSCGGFPGAKTAWGQTGPTVKVLVQKGRNVARKITEP